MKLAGFFLAAQACACSCILASPMFWPFDHYYFSLGSKQSITKERFGQSWYDTDNGVKFLSTMSVTHDAAAPTSSAKTKCPSSKRRHKPRQKKKKNQQQTARHHPYADNKRRSERRSGDGWKWGFIRRSTPVPDNRQTAGDEYTRSTTALGDPLKLRDNGISTMIPESSRRKLAEKILTSHQLVEEDLDADGDVIMKQIIPEDAHS